MMITRIASVLRDARIHTEARKAYLELLDAEALVLRDVGVTRQELRREIIESNRRL